MQTYEVHMILEKETKGALRYQEAIEKPEGSDSWVPLKIADGALIGTLYLRKSILVPGPILTHLRVSIVATP